MWRLPGVLLLLTIMGGTAWAEAPPPRHIAQVPTAPPGQPQLDHSRIIPVVKTRKWLDDIHEEARARGSAQEELTEPFSDDLVVAYAEDSARTFRYLTTGEYAGNRAELRTLAVTNLLRVLPDLEVRIFNPHVTSVSVGDDYTSSLLLVDDIWTSGRLKVKGDIVVAIPARDVILVTGSRSGTLKNFRALAEELHAKGPNALSDALFVYRDNRFKKFNGGRARSTSR